MLEPRYIEFFRDFKPGARREPTPPPGRAKAVVLVSHPNGVAPECDDSLRKLEREGVRVLRLGSGAETDLARDVMASDALHDGFKLLFLIDADLGFDPLDALRLLARPEPVIAGIYVQKRSREFPSVFADGITEAVLGAHAFGLYPLKYAAGGFPRIRASALRQMIEELDLLRCNGQRGRGVWPFFQPAIVSLAEGGQRYLEGD